jgi:IS5 family transposase
MLPKEHKSPLDLFRSRLPQILNKEHPLFRLADQIDWSVFEREFGPTYSEGMGRPAKPIRLLVGLHYLKHAFNESDESVVERWLENPYWQYFCGFEYFQHEFPLDPSLLVKWRQRVGPKRLEVLLKETLDTARREKLLTKNHLARVNMDTTVQEKNIAFPTDARLYHKMRVRLVREAKRRGIKLRQTYKRLGKQALIKQSQYARARQGRRARKMTKKLKTYLGCVVRDIARKSDPTDETLRELLARANRLLEQERDSKGKLYSVHEPDVECISKGKAHKKYEFGCKVGFVTTSKNNWIVGVNAFHGNPYDGHTLRRSLETMHRMTGVTPKHAHCDKGFRGHNYEGSTEIHIAGRGKKNRTRWERMWSRRRSAVEPTIGHAKADNRMERNFLKGKDGDQMNPILAACGYHIRKLIRAFFLPFFHELRNCLIAWGSRLEAAPIYKSMMRSASFVR